MLNKALLKYVGKSKKYGLLSMLFLTLRNLSLAGMTLLLAQFLAGLAPAPAGLPAGLPFGGLGGVGAGLLFLFLCLLRAFSAYWGTVSQARVVGEVKQNLRSALLEKLFRMGSRYRNYASTAEIINMGTDTIEQLENYYGRYLSELSTCLLTSGLMTLLFFFLNRRLALTFLLLAPIIPLFLLGMLKMVRKMQAKYWRKYQDVGQLFLDSLQGITTLKIFRADAKRAEELADKSEQFRIETMNILKMQLSSITLIEWIAYGGAAALMLLGMTEFSAGRLGLAPLLALLILALEAFRPMITLTAGFHVAMTGIAAGEKLLAFLEGDIPESAGGEDLGENCAIRLDRLSYSYPDAGRPVLQAVSACFTTAAEQPGFSAVVGLSGSGKSTLAKLISGEIPPSGPGLFYGDTPYSALDPARLATRITRVGHDVHIFAGTVRENLAMAADDESAMIRALQEVKLWDEIRGRGGLDLPLSMNAENLSGGQKQRLAIARALLNDSAVYIFDEATSNIDIESEEIILAFIGKLAAAKQVIVITHRLRSIMGAKEILVLDEGRTAGRGDHAALMAEPTGLYARMFRAQEAMETGRGGAV